MQELTAPRRLRPPLTLARMAYISRLQHEALRLADEAKGFLSVDPLDDESLVFQSEECVRRVQRIYNMTLKGPDDAG